MSDIETSYWEDRAYIEACTDVRLLLDKMAEYRDLLRAAVAQEWTEARLRISDLLELTEERIAHLKARSIRAKAVRPEAHAPARRERPQRHHEVRSVQKSTGRSPSHPARIPVENLRREHDPEVERRHAAEARADVAEAELERLRKTQAEMDRLRAEKRWEKKTLRAAPARVSAPARVGESTGATSESPALDLSSSRPGSEVVVGTGSGGSAIHETKEVTAPTPPHHETVEVPRSAPTITPCGNGASPGASGAPEKVADKKDDQPGTTAQEHTVEMPSEFASTTNSTVQQAPSTKHKPPARESNGPSFLGADLAKFRKERGLTQRALATSWGFSHGTIAKAELHVAKTLSPRLQEAMRRQMGEMACPG